MKTIIIAFLVFINVYGCQGQVNRDTIITKDNDTLHCSILSVSDSEIRCRAIKNGSTILLKIGRDEVRYISNNPGNIGTDGNPDGQIAGRFLSNAGSWLVVSIVSEITGIWLSQAVANTNQVIAIFVSAGIISVICEVTAAIYLIDSGYKLQEYFTRQNMVKK
ncbi:MAG: hypothetical protein NTW49_00960 [Bacteroidia bacterium]|nr:hypothetical protein [Bacteroidia bacterium]